MADRANRKQGGSQSESGDRDRSQGNADRPRDEQGQFTESGRSGQGGRGSSHGGSSHGNPNQPRDDQGQFESGRSGQKHSGSSGTSGTGMDREDEEA